MASRTDYKFAWIRQNSDGTTTALIRFYEGEITTAPEDGGDVVTRYRRTAIVARPRRDLDVYADRFDRYAARNGGWEVSLKSGRDLRDTSKRILAEDATRDPVDEQRVI